MGVVQSRTFRSGEGIALELPDELAIGPDLAVLIERHGDTLTIRPAGEPGKVKTGAELVAALKAYPRPSSVQERDPIEWPERPGL